MRAVLAGDDLAKALYNALIWCPKSDALWSMGYLCLGGESVTIITTDSYAVTLASAPAALVTVPEDFITWGKVARADLEAMGERATQARKQDVVLTLDPRRTVTYADHLEGQALTFPDLYQDADDGGESWDDVNFRVYQDLLEDRQEDWDSHQFMVDPAYLRKVAQMKRPAGVCADFWVRGTDPVFVRVGSTRTVIQPVHRETHADKNGDEVLW